MRSRSEHKPLVAVDVFSGVGGLTVGLKRAGFRVGAAVEIEKHAFSSYKANHPEVSAFKQDVCTVSGKSLVKAAGGRVDLVAGCPPCQGFSSLTSKWKRTDARNKLVEEMVRLVEEIRPTAVMMENVPGLAGRGKRLFSKFLRRLGEMGYVVEWDLLQLADYGVPQNRRRLLLLAGLGFQIPLPKPTHSRSGKDGLPKWRTLRSVIGGMKEPVSLQKANANGGPAEYNWHVVRTLSSKNIKRLKKALPGKPRFSLPRSLRPPCHQDVESGFGNVYGRMAWDQISPTITGGCTTLSKGRFGHPIRNRTISVREAASIQQFPPEYLFDCPYMEYVCDFIGNALPCDFAKIAARRCLISIRTWQGRKAGREINLPAASDAARSKRGLS